MVQNVILNQVQIEYKIRRIAYQIYETFSQEKEVVIAGINGNGYVLAQKIAKVLADISPLRVVLSEVIIDKKNTMNQVFTSINSDEYINKSVVIVDDVLHSGNTLVYGVKHFLEVPLKKLKTAVLIDRNHKRFPIKVDFKGLSLSTSLNEHVTVSFDEGSCCVYLS
ncbi:MAG: phosphoribosyltransferase domain-containing protein [Bacteroidota bacterium]|nr:phosphoribosyltransferase domain-containing protein [Bacteroidota bacterium]